jgi:hypothetical protein
MLTPLPHRRQRPIVDGTFFNWKNSNATSRAEEDPILDSSTHSEPIEFIWAIPNFSKSIQEDERSISSDSLTLTGSHFWKFNISLALSSAWWPGDVMDFLFFFHFSAIRCF